MAVDTSPSSDKGDGACFALFAAFGDGVGAGVDVNVLFAGAALMGAVPGVVNAVGVIHDVAAAVVNPYLEVRDVVAHRSETVVGFQVGGEDVGEVDEVAEDGDGEVGGVLTKCVVGDDAHHYVACRGTGSVAESGCGFVLSVAVNQPPASCVVVAAVVCG